MTDRMALLIAGAAAIRAAERALEASVVGSRVRIVTDFRDQPYGRSLPSLKGREYTLAGLSVEDGRLHLFLGGLRCSLRPDQIEFVSEVPND